MMLLGGLLAAAGVGLWMWLKRLPAHKKCPAYVKRNRAKLRAKLRRKLRDPMNRGKRPERRVYRRMLRDLSREPFITEGRHRPSRVFHWDDDEHVIAWLMDRMAHGTRT